MGKPSPLPEPWLSLARKLGGPDEVYSALQDIYGGSKTTAKHICKGTVRLYWHQWLSVDALLLHHGIDYRQLALPVPAKG